MKVVIETIPHKKMRYPTAGDWYWRGNTLHIKVSQLGDPYMEMLVASHELHEAVLCKKRGIKENEVTKFDKAFEEAREDDDCSEPGDSPSAPYRLEHRFAENIERLFCHELDIDWYWYEYFINSLNGDML